MLGFERTRVYKWAGDVSNSEVTNAYGRGESLSRAGRIEITDVFDLHTIPPRDVKRVVEEYLEIAHEKGFPVVRIIHGKGIGVQREMVRTILARTDFVLDWTDAPPEAGGLGATIVRFKVYNP